MQGTDWLARLRMYLAPFKRGGRIDPWDDSRIAPGKPWKEEISRALDSAAVAILLVGPGFLASEFVMEHELPALLNSAKLRGVALFPLIVGYCAYEWSDLHPYQAYNSPDKPLESLSLPEQNKILSDLAIAVNKLYLSEIERSSEVPASALDFYKSIKDIQKNLKDTRTAFEAQIQRRDNLYASIEQRLGFKSDLEFEKFFFRYYSWLNEEERFEFDQIRAMTEGPLQLGNRNILKIIEANPAILEIIPQMTALRQHLVFWLNKYDKVFSINRAMCLLYAGVEDGVPFPSSMDGTVDSWLLKNKPSKS